MEYFLILFCALSVPFTESYKTHFKSFDNVDDGLPIDGVTDYEVVPVRHMQHKRSINDLTLQTKINGVDHEIYLQPTEGLFAGTEMKIFTAKNSGNNVHFKLHPSVMQQVFLSFYQDQKTASSVTHSVNKDGMSEFNGIINDNIVISPMPNHLRSRRDILKKSNPFFEHEAEGFINTTEHIIYKRTFNNSSKLSSAGVFDNKMEIKSVSRRSAAYTPDIVYPEIMVFVDDVLFKKFNYDVVKAVEYTLSFWNSVDLRYREFQKPIIRLNIAGIVLLEEPISFINRATRNVPAGMVDVSLLLNGFAEFLNFDQTIEAKKDYDIAMLVTGKDVVDTQTNQASVAGLATLSGVCQIQNNKYISTGLIEDSNGYGGVIAAAHELAHILGAPHDEEHGHDHGGYETKRCSKAEGFIMSYNRYNENRILFSSCSKEAIVFTLSQHFAKCIQNNPAEYKNNQPLPRILPGQLMSFDQQCQNQGYIRAQTEKTTCLQLHCVSKEVRNLHSTRTFDTTWFMPPAEGSPCDSGKYCLAGECVNIVRNLPMRRNLQQVPKPSAPLKAPTIPKAPTLPRTPAPSKAPTSPLASNPPQRWWQTNICINGKCTNQVSQGNDDSSQINKIFKYFKGGNFKLWK